MIVSRQWQSLFLPASVLSIGTFDGVHLAHQELIKNLVQRSKELKVPSVLITFDPHPRQFVSAADQKSIAMLSSLDEKIKELSKLGLDYLIIIDFDRSFSIISAQQFVQDVIVEHFHPEVIMIGYDHKFGKGREGDIEFLRKQSQKFNFEVEEIPAFSKDDIKINSTTIRRLLENGEVEKAASLLGRNYQLCGIVAKGQQRGRMLGFPTANISLSDKAKLIPRDGVYEVLVRVGEEDKQYKGALNIGYRPSVDDQLRFTVEVYILDFDEDIYGQKICVEFLSFIRPEMKFGSVEQLMAQIKSDVAQIR